VGVLKYCVDVGVSVFAALLVLTVYTSGSPRFPVFEELFSQGIVPSDDCSGVEASCL